MKESSAYNTVDSLLINDFSLSVFMNVYTNWNKTLDLQKFDTLCHELFFKNCIPGAFVTIVSRDKILFEKAYGVKSLNTKKPVTAHSLFPIASLTKAFSGCLFSFMVQDDVLGFDDPLSMHLPELQIGPKEFSQHVLLSDLLNHRLGLVDDAIAVTTREKGWRYALYNDLKNLKPVASYGTEYHYFSTTYWVLELLCEKYYQTDWLSFLNERLFKPIGINNLCCSFKNYLKEDHTDLYNNEGGHLKTIDLRDFPMIYGPGAGLMLSAKQLQSWLLFHLNRGQYNGNTILKEHFLNRTYHPYTTITPVPEHAVDATRRYQLNHYGLGFKIGKLQSHPLYYHEGAIPGMRSILIIAPNHNIASVILTNCGVHDIANEAMFSLLDAL